MIARNLSRHLLDLAGHYPVVLVTGPRQSGKTTLCRACFPDLSYISLEPHDVREYAWQDPRGFLAEHRHGAILDEVQRVPELLSYLQQEVDERPEPRGRYILTGSQHFGLSAVVTQSLAGRTGVLRLLPCSLDELRRFPAPPAGLFETLWTGGYPAILDRQIPADRWLADYVTTYIQHDVRQVLQVGDLQAFTTFVKLCAGRSGQLLNLSALGADCGVSHNTARSWLSVLETSLIAFRLPAWHRNLKKQLVRSPKLHFYDSGLLCHLLGIQTPEQLVHHPLRGSIFESWAVSEVHKALVHAGQEPGLFFFRDHKGLEVDLVVERGEAIMLVEIKSGQTAVPQWEQSLDRLERLLQKDGEWRSLPRVVVYGGDQGRRGSRTTLLAWTDLPAYDWRGDQPHP